MSKVFRSWLIIGALAALLPAAWAQPPAASSSTSGPRASPRPDELEPGVDTSATERAPAASEAPAAIPVTKSTLPQAKPAEPAASAASTSRAASAKAKGAKTAGRQGDGKAQDRQLLDTTEITGNRELPKVMYIVPWKRADLGELASKPMNSLVDEVLGPIDRDVFRRQTRYYEALKPDQVRQGAPAPATPVTAESH
jgi:hypothetical protein